MICTVQYTNSRTHNRVTETMVTTLAASLAYLHDHDNATTTNPPTHPHGRLTPLLPRHCPPTPLPFPSPRAHFSFSLTLSLSCDRYDAGVYCTTFPPPCRLLKIVVLLSACRAIPSDPAQATEGLAYENSGLADGARKGAGRRARREIGGRLISRRADVTDGRQVRNSCDSL